MKKLYLIVYTYSDGKQILEIWDNKEIAEDRRAKYNEICNKNSIFTKILDCLAFRIRKVYIEEFNLNEEYKG